MLQVHWFHVAVSIGCLVALDAEEARGDGRAEDDQRDAQQVVDDDKAQVGPMRLHREGEILELSAMPPEQRGLPQQEEWEDLALIIMFDTWVSQDLSMEKERRNKVSIHGIWVSSDDNCH